MFGAASFVNTTVMGNTAVNDLTFGLVENPDCDPPTTCAHPFLEGAGAGIGVKPDSNEGYFEFVNSVAWGNLAYSSMGTNDHHPAQVMVLPPPPLGRSDIFNSNIQNNLGCFTNCSNPSPDSWFNIGHDLILHDPHFMNPASADFRHRSGAMASAGDSLLVPDDENDLDDNGITNEALPLDLTLGPRFLGAAVDMGAYEWCVGDLNLDGEVTGADLGMLLNNWGNPGIGDLTGDGIVTGADLGALLNAWGECGTENESGESMLLSGDGGFEALYGDYVDELLETWGFETWSEFLAWLETLEGWEVVLILEDLL